MEKPEFVLGTLNQLPELKAECILHSDQSAVYMYT